MSNAGSIKQEEIPKTMLAWRKVFPQTQLIREEVPVPEAPEDGYLIKVHAAGVCHSDYLLLGAKSLSGETTPASFTMGHECCGEVARIGEDAGRGFNLGDMIAVFAVPGCLKNDCPQCSRGVPQICEYGERYGLYNDGCYAPYIAVKSSAVVALPKGVAPETGAVATDAVVTALHAVKRTAQVKPEETIVIYGLGGLGFNALQIVQSIGSRVLVVEKRVEVLEDAVNAGVRREDVFSDVDTLAEHVKNDKIYVDTAIDFVSIPATFKNAQEIVRMAGKIVVVGLLAGELTLQTYLAVRKRLHILCSYGGLREDLEDALDLISRGVITPRVERGNLKDLPSVLEDLHAGKIKSRIALVPEDLGPS